MQEKLVKLNWNDIFLNDVENGKIKEIINFIACIKHWNTKC